MYGVSDVYKAQVKASTRDWAIRLALSLDSGETYDLTEQDVELLLIKSPLPVVILFK